jgi:hypothetical protein
MFLGGMSSFRTNICINENLCHIRSPESVHNDVESACRNLLGLSVTLILNITRDSFFQNIYLKDNFSLNCICFHGS